MTFPSVAGTNSGTNSATTSHTINFPASVASGDLLVLVTACESGFLTIDGFSELVAINNGVVGRVYYKVATGSEGGSATFTTGGSVESCYAIYRITGQNASGFIEDGSASADADPASLTPSWGSADTLWLACIAGRNSSNPQITAAPSGYSSLVAADVEAGIFDICCAIAYRQNAAATEDPGAFTAPGGTNAASVTVGIRPFVDPDGDGLAQGVALSVGVGASVASAAGLSQGEATTTAIGFGPTNATGLSQSAAASAAIGKAAAGGDGLSQGKATAGAFGNDPFEITPTARARAVAVGQARHNAAGAARGSATTEAETSKTLGAAGQASGAATSTAVSSVVKGAAGSSKGEAEATARSIADPVPISELEPQTGSTGGAGQLPPGELPQLPKKKKQRKRKTHVIKIGDWPDEKQLDDVTLRPLPVNAEVIDLDEVIEGVTFDELRSDDEEALAVILALAA